MVRPTTDAQRCANKLAQDAMDAVGRDPAEALALADSAVAAATLSRDPVATATAHRAAALALRELGDLAKAERRAWTAVRGALRAGSPTAAENRTTLAFILLESGRARAALHQVDIATTETAGLPAARVASQRALVLQRMGRVDEALAGYDAALPVLRRHHDRLWEARLLNNRGRLHTDRGALAQATTDLTASRSLLLAAGMPALASDVEWNLALVATLLGDVPLALARYETVRAEHVARGTPNPQLQVDRAGTLLSAGLASEALLEAERAVAALSSAHQDVDLPHAELVLSQAQTAVGDHAAGRETARRAHTLFARQHRINWARAANLAVVQATGVIGEGDSSLLAAASRAADDARQVGWALAELDARLVAAHAAGRLGNEPARRRQLELASTHRRSGSVDARIRGWFAEALLRQLRNDRRGVRAALAAGLRVLDDHQALLGATELRVNVSTAGTGLIDLGVQVALAAGRAREVLQWADRGRSRATRPRAVRPPQDPSLTDALAAVRRLHAQTAEAQLDGTPAPAAADLRRAERDVITASRKTVGTSTASAGGTAVRALIAGLGGRVLVEFVEHAGRLHRVVMADGRCTLTALGDTADLTAQIGQMHFGARRLATGFGTPRSRTMTGDAFRATADSLQHVLLGPPSAVGVGRELVIVPSASLHGVLWALLPSLWERPFVVAPSAAAWLQAAGTATGGDAGAMTRPPVLVAGPGLPAADAEIVGLAAHSPGATVLRHPHATASAVLAALDGTSMAHIAAHGALRTDNPLFSSLVMDDGPITVYDIEGLRSAPQLVVLSSCESGVSATRAGDELLGLVAALLSIGTRNVIATALRTPDVATAGLMELLHQGLRREERPPVALAGARAAVDRDDGLMLATAAGFTCFGG